MDYLHISSITDTAYDQHIVNSTDNSYFDHVYNTASNPDGEFTSALNQIAEMSKMMGSISSVNKNYIPYELFSGPIMGQLEELDGHILDILGCIVRESIAKDEWQTAYINTHYNPAGMLTNSLAGREKRLKFIGCVMHYID